MTSVERAGAKHDMQSSHTWTNVMHLFGQVSLANWILQLVWPDILAVIALDCAQTDERRWFFVHKDIDRILTRSHSRKNKQTHSNENLMEWNRIISFFFDCTACPCAAVGWIWRDFDCYYFSIMQRRRPPPDTMLIVMFICYKSSTKLVKSTDSIDE